MQLSTERLYLRPLTPEVYKEAFETMNDEELKAFFGCRNETELEEERKKFRDGLSMYGKTILIFQLIEKETAQILGWCGYHTWYLRHNRAEIGYVLSDESKRRQGFMREALSAVLQYGFEEMNLHRIEAMTSLDNEASMRLLTSNGFVQEGILREHYLVNCVHEDSVMFGLVRR